MHNMRIAQRAHFTAAASGRAASGCAASRGEGRVVTRRGLGHTEAAVPLAGPHRNRELRGSAVLLGPLSQRGAGTA